MGMTSLSQVAPRARRWLASALALLATSFPVVFAATPPEVVLAADPVPGAVAAHVIDAHLAAALQRAAPDAFVRVYVVLAEQLDPSALRQAHARLSPRERRAALAAELRAHATLTQGPLRALLAQAAAMGRARLIDVLWMGNALLLEATPAFVQQLASQPGVDRVRALRAITPAQVQDAAPAANPSPAAIPPTAANPSPAASAPAAGVIAPYPFFDDFDSGVLAPWWEEDATAEGRVRVTTEFGPLGSHHVVMDAAVDGVDSIANITTQFDLTGRTGVGLRFRQKEMTLNGSTGSDENHPEDGVFVSDDGVTWHQVLLLNNQGAQYQVHWLRLDDFLVPFNLTFNSTFFVRFQWRDNFSAPDDGMAYDIIEVGPGVDGPPPAVPTPNLVAQQATKLWEQGYRGDGTLIGSIDAGTWKTHPDLVDRLWSNPGEIAGNGLDDDNNGYIDDLWGWDFENGDADPQSTDAHGTQSAGLMLGDGTSGTITGMAPGATLVTCQVLTEADYWLAQQYLLGVGVDVVCSSYSYKWDDVPDYAMFRQLCDLEWAAGVVHANSIGNQGQALLAFPIPFNVSTPGNVPSPFWFPGGEQQGRSSVLACGGLNIANDTLYALSGRGPSAWEDMTLYDAAWPHPQQPQYWDYPVGGFGGSLPGLVKPDLVTYTNSVTSTTIPVGTPPVMYAAFSGTSAATPQLGGALALLRQVQPDAEPRHLAAALEFTAVDLGVPGKDNQFGAGHVRAWRAARRLVLLAAATPDVVPVGGALTLKLRGQPDTLTYGFLGAGLVTNLGDWNLGLPFFALPPFVTDPTGALDLPLLIPNDPILAGLVVWTQFGQPRKTPAWGNGKFLSVPEAISITP